MSVAVYVCIYMSMGVISMTCAQTRPKSQMEGTHDLLLGESSIVHGVKIAEPLYRVLSDAGRGREVCQVGYCSVGIIVTLTESI